MTLSSRLRSWVQAILRRSRMESEMDAELRFHVEAYAEDLVRSGVPRQEAMRRARIASIFSKRSSKMFATACACCARIRDLPLWQC
jgi:hypothetical protein